MFNIKQWCEASTVQESDCRHSPRFPLLIVAVVVKHSHEKRSEFALWIHPLTYWMYPLQPPALWGPSVIAVLDSAYWYALSVKEITVTVSWSYRVPRAWQARQMACFNRGWPVGKANTYLFMYLLVRYLRLRLITAMTVFHRSTMLSSWNWGASALIFVRPWRSQLVASSSSKRKAGHPTVGAGHLSISSRAFARKETKIDMSNPRFWCVWFNTYTRRCVTCDRLLISVLNTSSRLDNVIHTHGLCSI